MEGKSKCFWDLIEIENVLCGFVVVLGVEREVIKRVLFVRWWYICFCFFGDGFFLFVVVIRLVRNSLC